MRERAEEAMTFLDIAVSYAAITHELPEHVLEAARDLQQAIVDFRYIQRIDAKRGRLNRVQRAAKAKNDA